MCVEVKTVKKKKTVIECRNYYLPTQFPLLVLQGENWRISDVRSSRLHFHNCLEIGYCHTDSGMMEFYGEKVEFKEGDITIVPRNVPHTTYSSKGSRSKWSYIFLDPKSLLGEFLPANWENYDLLTHEFQNYRYIFRREEYPNLYHLLMLILKEIEEQEDNYQQSTRALLLSFYLLIHRVQSKRGSSNKSQSDQASTIGSLKTLEIAPALEYIEENFAKQFSVTDLADICHWSPTHFRRVFTNIMGLAPLDYVNNTRIMKSCYLLSNTEESILAISEKVGFQSVSSYNRNFKRVLGRSPSEYRQELQRFSEMDVNPSIQEYSGWLVPPENVDS